MIFIWKRLLICFEKLFIDMGKNLYMAPEKHTLEKMETKVYPLYLMEMDNDENRIFTNKLLLSHRTNRLDESLLIFGVCPHKVARTKILKKNKGEKPIHF